MSKTSKKAPSFAQKLNAVEVSTKQLVENYQAAIKATTSKSNKGTSAHPSPSSSELPYQRK